MLKTLTSAPPSRPPEGWLRATRESLGLSRRAVAEKLGVTHAAVRDYEVAETRDTITLATLRRTAAALDCELVVALVPRAGRSFEDTIIAPSHPPPGADDELESHLK